MTKEEMIVALNNVSKLVEYIKDHSEVEYKVNSIEFSDLVKHSSYYKIDEIADYLQTLSDLEKKNKVEEV